MSPAKKIAEKSVIEQPRESFPIAAGPVDEDHMIIASHVREGDDPAEPETPAPVESTRGIEDGEGEE